MSFCCSISHPTIPRIHSRWVLKVDLKKEKKEKMEQKERGSSFRRAILFFENGQHNSFLHSFSFSVVVVVSSESPCVLFSCSFPFFKSYTIPPIVSCMSPFLSVYTHTHTYRDDALLCVEGT